MLKRPILKYLWSHSEQRMPIIILSKNDKYYDRFILYLNLLNYSTKSKDYGLYHTSNLPILNIIKTLGNSYGWT